MQAALTRWPQHCEATKMKVPVVKRLLSEVQQSVYLEIHSRHILTVLIREHLMIYNKKSKPGESECSYPQDH